MSVYASMLRRLFEICLAQVVSFRLDERMKLGKEGDGPHEVAADDGEDERGSPESGDLASVRGKLQSPSADGRGEAHTWFSPFGERNQEATQRAAMTTRPMKMA